MWNFDLLSFVSNTNEERDHKRKLERSQKKDEIILALCADLIKAPIAMALKQLNSQQTRRKACDGEPKWMDSIVKMNKILLDEECHIPVRVSIQPSVR